ncbi:hypothetical protein [Kordia sp.]|uniref:hypothetical protein n=1 Tax=Kordia sp. TaxID=1965332 RepID=UPI003D2AED0A
MDDNNKSSRFSLPNFRNNKSKKNKNTKDTELPEEHLKQSGFFSVFNNPEKPKEAFKELFESHNTKRKELWKSIEDIYDEKITRLENRIEELEAILNEEKTNLKNHEAINTEAKKKQLEDLVAEINELTLEVKKLLEELASKKENGVNERIRQIREELKGLTETLEEITLQRDKINDEAFNKDKDLLKTNADFWDTISKKYENTLEALNGKSLILFKNGITPKIANFFILTGVSATFVAGWLFAVFSSSKVKKIDDEDWLFYILESLYSFGNNIQISNNLKDWQWMLYFLTSLLVLFTFVTFLGWVCKRLFVKWFIRSKKKSINAQSTDYNPFTEQIETVPPRFLIVWLKWFPYIFIGGVIYLVIQLGTDLESLKKLDVYLSGQALGSALALVIGGLAFIYINNIIMPRFKDDEKPESQQKPLRKGLVFLGKSFELLLLLLVFLITFLVMYFKEENGAGALIGFVTASLIAGYLLGNGLRFKGLLDTKRYLENRFITLKLRSYQILRPLRSRLDELENNLFTKGFLALERELLELLIQKTSELNPDKQISSSHEYSVLLENIPSQKKSSKKEKGSFFKPIKKFFNRFKKTKEEDALHKMAHVTKHEKVMFPVETQKIGFLEKKLKKKIKESEDIKEYLESLSEQNDSYQKDVKRKVSEALEFIDEYQYQIIEETEKRSEALKLHQKENLQYEIALQDGYDLGHWYLKYGTDEGFKK